MCFFMSNAEMAQNRWIVRLLFWFQLQLGMVMFWLYFGSPKLTVMSHLYFIAGVGCLIVMLLHKRRLMRLENRDWLGRRLSTSSGDHCDPLQITSPND